MTHLLPVHRWNVVLMAGVRTCMLFSRLLASVSRVNHPETAMQVRQSVPKGRWLQAA